MNQSASLLPFKEPLQTTSLPKFPGELSAMLRRNIWMRPASLQLEWMNPPNIELKISCSTGIIGRKCSVAVFVVWFFIMLYLRMLGLMVRGAIRKGDAEVKNMWRLKMMRMRKRMRMRMRMRKRTRINNREQMSGRGKGKREKERLARMGLTLNHSHHRGGKRIGCGMSPGRRQS